MLLTFSLGLSGNEKLLSIDYYESSILDEIIKLFDIKPNEGINLIFENKIYSDFSFELFNIIQESENKIINIMKFDVLDLLHLTESNTEFDWKFTSYQPDDLEFMIYDTNVRSYYYSEKEGIFINLNIVSNIIIDDNKYYIDLDIRYFLKVESPNEVNCHGHKCRRQYPRCKERYCESCWNEWTKMSIEEYLELTFQKVIVKGDKTLLNYDVPWLSDYDDDHNDSDSDDDSEFDIIEILDGSSQCKLSSLKLFDSTDDNCSTILKVNKIYKID